MPLRDDLTDEERMEAELMMVIGRMARYFHTPIGFFLNLTPREIELWVEVMNELIDQENKANEKAFRGR